MPSNNLNLWKRFERHFVPEPMTGCWLFMTVHKNGYGKFAVNRRVKLAHRVVYELLRGSIPRSMTIDHLCKTKSCVNPEHLQAVTQRENVRRGESHVAKQMAQILCKNGHAFDSIRRSGVRFCSQCKNAGQRKNYAERVARKRMVDAQ